jgi:hypothetical protein
LLLLQEIRQFECQTKLFIRQTLEYASKLK